MSQTLNPDGGIILRNIEIYTDAIAKLKEKILKLAQDGVITQQTATRIILEHEYSIFQQIVSIEYQKKEEEGS